VVAALLAGELPVVVANLASARFCQSHWQLAKTDALDAQILARFAESVRRRSSLKSAKAGTCRLVARRRQILEMITAETTGCEWLLSVRGKIWRPYCLAEKCLQDLDKELAGDSEESVGGKG